jgi:antitoxin FitA
MASITISDLDDSLKTRLKIRAAEHGSSMEDEARCILLDAFDKERPRTLVDLALDLFGPEHGVDFEPHPPVEPREPPRFDDR